MLTQYERETIINYNEEEKEASVYTHNKSLIKKLLDNCNKHPDKYKLEQRDGEAYTFIVPKRYVSIRAPKQQREYTEEEKAEIKNRFAKTRAKLP